MDALTLSISLAGGVGALASRIEVGQTAVSNWRKRGGRVPAEWCPAIERATDGRVTVNDLRPDMRWHRVPDSAWPHLGGRPCLDVAGPSTAPRIWPELIATPGAPDIHSAAEAGIKHEASHVV